MKYSEARYKLDSLLDELGPARCDIEDFLENAVMIAEARCNVPAKRRPHTRKLCLEFWKALNEQRTPQSNTEVKP